ncbi:isochorismatase family protein [Phaeodactylibacter sp.]|uniref:isochorismatase family protein n=1 Tax=Phaeodactylibacter sp. TaxID=1940289 RepID=UPI0025CE2B0C|nr:isochorismatase family protein [Phaeodactylibacter sp.]MCI4651707.1 isochorismatase family protein [Phaeodactylibacter sp.]MCI5090837.1 isochorismatase family protein [Phaeodactylibacter sp.]
MKKAVVILFFFLGIWLSSFAQNNSVYTEKLTKDNTTLVMVDFLGGFVPGIRTIDRNLFYANAEALARIGEIFKLPTIMLGDEGGFRGEFFPAVKENLPDAIYVERHTVSAWDEPNFRKEIEKIGRKKVVLGGISIDICTAQLTLDLIRAGYTVYVVVDASGSDTNLNEIAAMMRLTQAGAIMINWGTLASELMKDWQTPEGPAVGELYQKYSYWGNSELSK